jgi:hypothetical protein
MIVTGRWRTGRKTLPIATLSTTNLTWTDLGSNPDLRGGGHPSSYRAVNSLRLGYKNQSVIAV